MTDTRDEGVARRARSGPREAAVREPRVAYVGLLPSGELNAVSHFGGPRSPTETEARNWCRTSGMRARKVTRTELTRLMVAHGWIEAARNASEATPTQTKEQS